MSCDYAFGTLLSSGSLPPSWSNNLSCTLASSENGAHAMPQCTWQSSFFHPVPPRGLSHKFPLVDLWPRRTRVNHKTRVSLLSSGHPSAVMDGPHRTKNLPAPSRGGAFPAPGPPPPIVPQKLHVNHSGPCPASSSAHHHHHHHHHVMSCLNHACMNRHSAIILLACDGLQVSFVLGA